MPANVVVRARIDEHTKEEVAAVLAAMGLTLSDAFRLPTDPDRPRKDAAVRAVGTQ